MIDMSVLKVMAPLLIAAVVAFAVLQILGATVYGWIGLIVAMAVTVALLSRWEQRHQ